MEIHVFPSVYLLAVYGNRNILQGVPLAFGWNNVYLQGDILCMCMEINVFYKGVTLRICMECVYFKGGHLLDLYENAYFTRVCP